MNQGCSHSIEKLNYFKPYGCGICNLRFSNPIQLDDHIFVNHYTEVTATRCCYCTRTFSNETSLKLHIKAKHKIQYCRCSFCSASYENLRHLKTLNNRRYFCSFCHKYFYRRKALNDHLIIHEKPMRCKICGKKFNSRLSLVQHLINEHPEEKCDWSPSRVSTGSKNQGSSKVRTISQKVFSLIFFILPIVSFK